MHRAALALVLATTLLSACTILFPRKGTVRIANMTESTAVCTLTDAHQPLAEAPAAPGAHIEVELREGSYQLCVRACEEADNVQGDRSDVVGCDSLRVRKGERHEIAIVEGEGARPPAPAEGFTQIVWHNALDPALSNPDHQQPWLTPFGKPAPGVWHARVDNGACARTISVEFEDARGKVLGRSIEPGRSADVWSADAPAYAAFLVGVTGKARRVWDLPAGSHQLRVSGDCKSLELVGSRLPDGAEDQPKRVTNRQK